MPPFFDSIDPMFLLLKNENAFFVHFPHDLVFFLPKVVFFFQNIFFVCAINGKMCISGLFFFKCAHS